MKVKKISPETSRSFVKSCLTLLTVFMLFTACEEDFLLNEPNHSLQEIEEEYTEFNFSKNDDNVEVIDYSTLVEVTDDNDQVNLRSNWQSIYSRTISLKKGKWKLIRFSKDHLSIYSIRATVRPRSGNPDLYTWGYSTRYRRINGHNGYGNHTLELKLSHLKSNEKYGYIGIYATNDSRFSLRLYKQSTVFPQTVLKTDNNTASTSSIYGSSLNVFNDDGENGQNLVGECTWYAYGRVVELVKKGYLPTSAEKQLRDGLYSGTGRHAKNWTWKVRGHWYDTNKKVLPKHLRKKGMLVVWKNASDQHGHVAFIEEISSDKSEYRISSSDRPMYDFLTYPPKRYSNAKSIRFRSPKV